MKCLVLGDVHGCWKQLNLVLEKAISKHKDITHIIQVGDLAYGWPTLHPFQVNLSSGSLEVYNNATKLWLDGNHENHDRLEEDNGIWFQDWQYMPRGSVLEIGKYKAMFFGGASSIDKNIRTPHISWWPQEYIRYPEVRRALQEHGPIDIIFSHEHPIDFPYSDRRYDTTFGDADKKLLNHLLEKFRPRFWCFGHHHFGEIGKTRDTQWCCCPIIESLQYTIWDGTRLALYR